MKYKIKNTDLFLKGKLIPEGKEVDLSKDEAESLSDFLEEMPDNKETKTDIKTKSKTGDKK